MDKIYNNLNIENLTKTEWFNQFYPNEQKQILLGLEDNLDVSIYANLDYDEYQMEEIRLGLTNNLNVSIYANSKYPWREMKQIREKLEKKK